MMARRLVRGEGVMPRLRPHLLSRYLAVLNRRHQEILSPPKMPAQGLAIIGDCRDIHPLPAFPWKGDPRGISKHAVPPEDRLTNVPAHPPPLLLAGLQH